MMISTKGRYALRAVIDIAQHEGDGNIPLKDVSERQGLSIKYLESIVPALCRGGVLRSRRGKEGGYTLAKGADRITVAEVIELTEGRLAPVSCLECGENVCERAESCLTLPMWERLDGMITGFLENVSIKDLIEGKKYEQKVEK